MRQLLCSILAALLVPACSSSPAGTTAPEGSSAALRAIVGSRARVVWVQEDGTDPLASGSNLALMGFDTDDGRGERMIASQRGSYVKPMFTPGGDRIVFSRRSPRGARIYIVNWDGSEMTPLGDGYALAVWRHPSDGSEWIYAGADVEPRPGALAVTRFRIETPAEREPVWSKTPVGLDTFQLSADGRRAAGLFPWPHAGIAELPDGEFRKLGEGCWTALANARGPLMWYFDGSHRKITMVDVDADRRWGLRINNAPGFNDAEIYYPRWTNHPRFLVLSGPYNQGGVNQVRSGGNQVEIHVGRFSKDFTNVESWARVTNNAHGDLYADVWIDRNRSPHSPRPDGQIGPRAGDGRAASLRSPQAPASAGVSRAELVVRLTRPGPVPSPEAILPYRDALVISEYEVVEIVTGTYGEKKIRIAQWAIRDSRVLPGARKTAGTRHRLTVERYDAHPELEGERLITENDPAGRPVYYSIGRP